MRCCLPSYQLPGSWLSNLRALEGLSWVEGVELLFFSFDDEARELFAAERDDIAAFSDRFSLSLHLPELLTPDLGSLVEMSEAFVKLYVFHPFEDDPREGEPDEAGEAAPGALSPPRKAWANRLEALRARHGRERFAMEYTGEAAFEGSLALAPDLPLCADTGCLIRNGQRPAEWIAKRAGSIVEVHLHAARGNKDHFPLSGEDLWAAPLASAAASSDWRVVFETFSLETSLASREAFRRWLP